MILAIITWWAILKPLKLSEEPEPQTWGMYTYPKSVMAELKKKNSEKTRSTYTRHGAVAGRVFDVSVADLKAIASKIK
jgi:hypothetical protein